MYFECKIGDPSGVVDHVQGCNPLFFIEQLPRCMRLRSPAAVAAAPTRSADGQGRKS